MPTAVIADDEPMMRASLRDQMRELWPQLDVVGEAGDGPSALQTIESARPDIAFVDIRMPGMTGLQVARALTVPTKVVFVTAFDTHAVEAFEANAVDYVVKPVSTDRLAKVVAKLKKMVEAGMPVEANQLLSALERLGLVLGGPNNTPGHGPRRLDWLHMDVGRHVQMVSVDEVMYFESDSKYTRVVTSQADGLITTSLKDLLGQLDERFFVQVHRSAVVNRRFIHAVHRRDNAVELELRGRQERIKVSSANHHLFKAT
jgi:DNA-binding LytR/AlgR family response regulator